MTPRQMPYAYADVENVDPSLSILYKNAFTEAHEMVLSKNVAPDAYLRFGALASPGACYTLVTNTKSHYAKIAGTSEDEKADYWNSETVSEIAKLAFWGGNIHRDSMSFELSAKAFLETCAELKLGIKFTESARV
jgi:hypothetical protein